MGRIERKKLIEQIETRRKSRLIVYMTGDRRGLETKIATDVYPFFMDHLSRIGERERIDLFLYSTGGDTIAGYALVNMIREFCSKFGVIIPFKALSCATLITLGADDVIMTKMSQLGPIDPSVVSPLGPYAPAPGPPGATQIVPISVEDVISYLDLARKEMPLKDEDSLVRIFDRLSQNVNPLALGAVNRVREQIRFLSKELLKRHMSDQDRIDHIVDVLIKLRFSHNYVIGRTEARDVLRLNIADQNGNFEKLVLDLYREYDKLLKLSVPYHPESVLGKEGKDSNVASATFKRAVIESTEKCHVFETVKEVTRITVMPPQVQQPVRGYMERIISEEWVERD